MTIRIFPPENIIETSPLLPLSKSESARTVIIDAIAGCETQVGLAHCDDTDAIVAGACSTRGTVNVGLAGTALRFLTALYAATPGADIVLTGAPRLLERPIGPLVDALRRLGADITYTGSEGCAPLHIVGAELAGGPVSLPAGISSQFVSALMMIAPLMKAPLQISLSGDPVSASYINMTAAMMKRRGVDADVDLRSGLINIPASTYNTTMIPVERDWSAASYWYSITALSAGWVTLDGLKLPSLQGDSDIARIAQMFGVITAPADGSDALELSPSPDVFARLDLDMSDTPDLVQAVVVTACMLGIPFCLTGVSTLVNKETDRLAALRTELLKVGFVIETGADSIAWDGSRVPVTEMPVFDTYDDHRMAMALAPIAIFVPGIAVNDPGVVSKSYPTFWDDLREAGFIIETVQSADDQQ